MSNPFHCFSWFSKLAICSLSARSLTIQCIQVLLYFFFSSSNLSLHFYSFLPISNKLKPYSENIYAKPRPIPQVKPVISTQHFPYFLVRASADNLEALRQWGISQFQALQVLQSHLREAMVSVETPVRKRKFLSSLSVVFTKDPRQSATLLRRVEKLKRELNTLAMGLQSTRIDFNI